MTLYHMLLLPHCISPTEVVPVVQTKDDTRLRRLTCFSSLFLTEEQQGTTCQDLVVLQDLNTESFLFGKHKQHCLELCAKNSLMCLRWHIYCNFSVKSKLHQKSESQATVSPHLWRVFINVMSMGTELNAVQMRKCFFSLLLQKTSALKYFSCTFLQTGCFIKPCYYKSSLFQSLDPQSLFVYRFLMFFATHLNHIISFIQSSDCASQSLTAFQQVVQTMKFYQNIVCAREYKNCCSSPSDLLFYSCSGQIHL